MDYKAYTLGDIILYKHKAWRITSLTCRNADSYREEVIIGIVNIDVDKNDIEYKLHIPLEILSAAIHSGECKHYKEEDNGRSDTDKNKENNI